ncbi:MAG: radical SAM protein [Thermoprotei archaeon]|nr:MAG: radical SAM protein [Thermoprotei archaeon]
MLSEAVKASLQLLATLKFEVGPIRPPSEGGSHSLLIRATRNCPWSKCKFCYGLPYDRKPFQIRFVDEVKADIDSVELMLNELRMLSKELGFKGEVNDRLALTLIAIEPALAYSPWFSLVFNWARSGCRTVFIQDADSLIMKTDRLCEIIRYLRAKFPTIERVTSYARAKTLYRKSLEELKELRASGLTRLHVGLESGDDEVLAYVNKGVTSQEHVEAGRKAIEAGFELSEYVMPGLGGADRWREHALNTAKVLNEINPHYIRVRSLVPRKGTPLYDDFVQGRFKLLTPHGYLKEIRLLVEKLDVDSRISFDHFCNPAYKTRMGLVHVFSQDHEGYKLPDEKEEILKAVDRALEVEESRFIRPEDLAEVML